VLASYVVMAAGLHHFAQKSYRIPYEYGKIVKILAAIFECGALYYYLYFQGALSLFARSLILALFIATLFFMRVVQPREVERLLGMLRWKK